MRRIRDYFSRMMWGRNGVDDLGNTILVGTVIVYLLYMFTGNSVLYLAAAVGMLYSIFRIFSTNTDDRSLENRKFLSWCQVIKLNFTLRKTHRVFLCKTCGKKIKVPKGKGRIEITCPACGNKMIRRT